MKTKITLLLFCITGLVFSQPNIDWEISLGGSTLDFGRSAITTSDGNYIIAGSTASSNGDVTNNHGGADFWLVKLSDTGTLLWEKTLGGSDSDKANKIIQTSDGGFMVVGESRSTDGDLTQNNGNFDWWVVKVDDSGNLQWQKSLGGSGWDTAYDVQQTNDGGYIVAGANNSNDGDVSGNQGGKDFWVVKLDASGNVLWSKSLGGTTIDEAHSIRQTPDGGYIVAGNSSSNNGDVGANYGIADFWIVKLDASGTLQWEKNLGGSAYDQAYSIITTSDGGYLATGYSASNDNDVSGNHGEGDIWTVKLDNTGTIQWQKSLGGSLQDSANDVQQTTDGGYIIIGDSESTDGDITNNQGGNDVWILKLTPAGSLEWQKNLGGSGQDFGSSIRQTPDDGFIIAANSDSSDGDVSNNLGASDFWAVKLNPILGVAENDSPHFLICPNPSNGLITIQLKQVFESITVTNILGKVVYKDTNIAAQNYTLDLQHTKGIHLIKITSKKSTYVFKVIIK